MAQADNELKARTGTFARAVDLESHPLGTSRSQITAWSKREPHSVFVSLALKHPKGLVFWEMNIDPTEAVSGIRASLQPKTSPTEDMPPPVLEDFMTNWDLAEKRHVRNERRRLASA